MTERWQSAGKKTVVKDPEEYLAEAAGIAADQAAPCSNCGCKHAPGGKCRHCGKTNRIAAERQATQWKCDHCGCTEWRGEANSEVEVTRHPTRNDATVRKRICKRCGQCRFETHEVVVPRGYNITIVPE